MAQSHHDIKASIIESARNFFGRYGFYKTTVDEIAKSLRMGKSSLYYYFKNKEEIFVAVLDEEIKILKDEMEKALQKAQKPQGRLKAYVTIRMHAIKKMANFYTVFKDEYMKSYAFIQKIRYGYDCYEVSLIKEILTHGITIGEFKIKNIDVTSIAIFTAVKGLEYEWATKITDEEIEKNIDMMLDILFFGIVKR